MQRKISQLGLQKLKQLEGCRLKAYQDTGGILTIGYGHTTAAGNPIVYPSTIISQSQAEKILKNDLKQYEEAVNNNVEVDLTSTQFDALVLFCYNVGVANFCRSTLLRKLNAKKYEAVPQELMKWTNVKGKLCAGLLHRRTAEIVLWNAEASISMPPKNKLRQIISILAPLGGIAAAIADMIAQSTILQITLAVCVIPAALLALYYYYIYNKQVI